MLFPTSYSLQPTSVNSNNSDSNQLVQAAQTAQLDSDLIFSTLNFKMPNRSLLLEGAIGTVPTSLTFSLPHKFVFPLQKDSLICFSIIAR